METPEFRAIFEASPVPCLVLDPEFRIVAMTDAYAEIALRSREDLLGHVIFDAFPDNPDDPAATGTRNLRASLERVRAARVPDVMAVQRYDIKHPDGRFEERYWNARNLPLLASDASLRYILHSVEDVTDLVRLQKSGSKMANEIFTRTIEAADATRELKEANIELARLYERSRELDELKSQFFANVSHELRTPLVLILGPTEELLRDGSLPESALEQVRLVDRNARLLLRHVNDLLEASRLESGNVELTYADVDLAHLVRLIAAHFESASALEEIELVVEADAPVHAEVDGARIQRVVFNLLANAVKFTPRGGTITCAVRPDLGAGRAVITVADSGPGIPVEHREAIFERFNQLEVGTSRRFGGTGLGLAISRDVVALHEGSITVAQGPAGGALFTVTLPLSAPPGATVHPAAAPALPLHELGAVEKPAPASDAEAPLVRDERPLVAVVEDNPELNRFVALGLGEQYQVVSALDGREGLELIRTTQPDVVLCDVMMPGISGDQLIRAVRGHRGLDVTPIVVLTARADEELRVLLLREGANDVMVKPFSIEELRTRVANLVEAKRAREQQAALAVELAERNLALQHLADHDELTGLLNRRRFDEELERHRALVHRYGAGGAVIVLDVDGFKQVNDLLGHGAGDAVLVQVASALRGRLRATDALARLGGDEFAVLLPVADEAEAQRVATDLLAIVRRIPMSTGGNVTLSAGVAVLNTERASTAEIIADADAALYAAKRQGRDRVATFGG